MGLAKIVFGHYQTNKYGESLIFIRVIEDRKSLYIKTDLYCKKVDWDFKSNCFKTNYRKIEDFEKIKDHEKNNGIFLKKIRETNDFIKDLIQDDNVISSEQVKEKLHKINAVGKKSVLNYNESVTKEIANQKVTFIT
ncbi:MAG: hypothetical protein KBA50_03055 [Sedimentibacter sp.]|nr:hypothetical protein [Sedimentibacter sp.]